jgi:hypothetical protein
MTTFQVTFDPSAVGLRTATLTIANDDADEAAYDFAIQGTGTATPLPEIDVVGNSVAIADGDTTPAIVDHTDFGSTDVATGTVVRTFTIQNSGSADLSLTGTPLVMVSGANAADFTVTALPTTPVTAAGMTTFQVSFDPSSIGLRTATLTIANDDADEAPYDFAIQGTGVATPVPEIDVVGNTVSIADGDTTPALADHTDFGSTDVATGTVVRTFTIQNSGSANLNLTGTPLVIVGGTNAADFTVTALPTTPVTAAGMTTFQVSFDPSAIGLRTATLTIANDDADEASYDFAIQGTGTATPVPEIDVVGNTVSIADGDTTPALADHTDFGSTDVTAGTVVRTFTIQNSGTANLNLTGAPLVIVGGTNAADFTVTALPTTPVTAAGMTTFQVTFDPSAAGLRTATLTIANDDADEAAYDFAIEGTGIDATTSNSFSGFVYVDVNNNGIKDPVELGLPNIPITITGPVTQTVSTGPDGGYLFDDLPSGIYGIGQAHPLVFVDGVDVIGTPALGTALDDSFIGVGLTGGMNAENYNFGERGLDAPYVSKTLLLASTPPPNQLIERFIVAPGTGDLLPIVAAGDGILQVVAEAEDLKLELYSAGMLPVAIGTSAGSLQANVEAGQTYLLNAAEGEASAIVNIRQHVWGETPVRTNPENPMDVNFDGRVSALDALLVINSLYASSGDSSVGGPSLYYMDVNRDDGVTALDALVVVNGLGKSGVGSAVPSGEAVLVHRGRLADGIAEADTTGPYSVEGTGTPLASGSVKKVTGGFEASANVLVGSERQSSDALAEDEESDAEFDQLIETLAADVNSQRPSQS